LIFLLAFLLAGVSCTPTLQRAERILTPSIKSEKEMGREFAEKALEKLELVEDPRVIEYIAQIGGPIIEAAQPMSYQFRFHVIKGPILNAFAVPGGHIYLYSGLLLKARNVHEVAGVIAHELSHVKHRHTARMVGKGTLVSLATLAAILAARGQRAVTAGALGAGQALQLKFSREFEAQADRSGLFYLYQAGYDPYGLLDFFSLLLREQRFSTSRIPPYLLTHPVTADRLTQIENLIRIHRLKVRHPRKLPDFHRLQGILLPQVERSSQVIPFLRRRLQESPDNPRLWHQLALAYDHYGWIEEARQALNRALSLDPELGSAWMDLGSLEARLGQWEAAASRFRKALQIRPNGARVYVSWGEMLLKINQPGEAERMFRKALELQPRLIRVHRLLARALKEQGREGNYHEEMASYWEKMDHISEALQHLKKAGKLYGEKTPEGERIRRKIESIQSS